MLVVGVLRDGGTVDAVSRAGERDFDDTQALMYWAVVNYLGIAA